ncbi:hypothetical protein U9M48_029868 [Paspalum notatum var. saurae]|uniref:Uncharacterized protein n=1 Tax=Paspalum notatum var. saurae TaxID=547442 RepID=A0AAQ3TZH2_PASNO
MVARHHPWTQAASCLSSASPSPPSPGSLAPPSSPALAALTHPRGRAAMPLLRPKTAPVSPPPRRDPDPCPTVAALPLLPAARLHPTPRHQTRRRSSPRICCVSLLCRSLAFAVVEPCPHAAALSRLPQPQQHRALPCLCRAASPTHRRSGQCFQWLCCLFQPRS